MPASQHQSPKSDIEIAQSAKKRPIMDLARERLGIEAKEVNPQLLQQRAAQLSVALGLSLRKEREVRS